LEDSIIIQNTYSQQSLPTNLHQETPTHNLHVQTPAEDMSTVSWKLEKNQAWKH